MKATAVPIALATLLLSGCTFRNPAPRAVPSATVDAKLSGAVIELSAPCGGVLCLHVSTNGEPHTPRSIFLDPDRVADDCSQFRDGNWVGIRTSAGQLLIDPAKSQWTLRNASGGTVIPPSPLPAQPATTSPIALPIHANGPADFYGSGDVASSLLHISAVPYLGNGHATIPYYFSTTGYAAFGTSGDDNTPPDYFKSLTSDSPITWYFHGTSANLYLMPARDLKAAAAALAQLTGHAPVPPRWTLGYLQSRWGWKNSAYLQDTAREFKARHLPVDAFIFDFEWYTPTPDYTVKSQGLPDFHDFSFNPTLLPQPRSAFDEFHQQGIHVVGIRKPRLGNFGELEYARTYHWILPAGNSDIDSRVLNFALPAVRNYYAEHTEPLLSQGVDGWWNDEGELTYTLYHYWNLAEIQSLAEVRPTARHWSLNRAFSPGLQRTGAAAWTGDIHATWDDLQQTPTTLLNWSLAGMPWTACDIGGFSPETNPKLLTRWMQAGVFFPIMRTHSTLEATPHFPWLFGAEAQADIKSALQLRYELIPYYYSLAHQAHESGLPLMRPLVMEFPGDPHCTYLSDEWLMGDSLLAAPILSESDSRSVYLPGGASWYRFNSSAGPLPGNQSLQIGAAHNEIPVYVRAGSIVPLGPATLEHTDDLPGGPLDLRVYPGKDASFTLVEDDGCTTAYLRGKSRRTTFTWNDASRTLRWKREGSYAGKDVFQSISVTSVDLDRGQAVAAPFGATGEVRIPR
ncbi:MAG TPA: TIM-barrel domain-containing protein [Phycisphaerae bacterium]|nr:TIM-barrel domain-containing protein [Phycisphaerae bacterium]